MTTKGQLFDLWTKKNGGGRKLLIERILVLAIRRPHIVYVYHFSIAIFSSRPHHSTKKRPSSQQTITLRPHVISTSINLRTNISAKIPTQPPRHSMRPMSTDSLVAANSIHIGHYTNTVSAGWQATTEPGFITSMDRNSIQQDSGKQGAQWQFTTEPGFVTRFKIKPSSNKPKPTKKPFPGNLGKNSTKHGNKVSRPTMSPPTTTVR